MGRIIKKNKNMFYSLHQESLFLSLHLHNKITLKKYDNTALLFFLSYFKSTHIVHQCNNVQIAKPALTRISCSHWVIKARWVSKQISVKSFNPIQSISWCIRSSLYQLGHYCLAKHWRIFFLYFLKYCW